MRVEMNQLLYDAQDPMCKYILSASAGKLYAFVQCIDRGMDLKARYRARYWGEYSHDDPEGSIRHILAHGGKWPGLPTTA
ncbi:hypothetical protein PRZ61_04970 [Halomonas pacifica]|uniref:Uncharacterized protein n=2 Tax=Halomonadaceae TaxID=28256 RepID=A0A1G8TY79_9GAMM|nr:MULTISPECIES: hypothetical protein [Halomonas]MDC8802797.1 hypothetical protein [Halomonas pacifica]QTP58155.1 hypothetical protein HNO53_05130 [Halomonas sulfidivorans]SDJ46508.1 hypothetical protein SAMN04487954_1057 [Halomonas gudaonensis]